MKGSRETFDEVVRDLDRHRSRWDFDDFEEFVKKRLRPHLPKPYQSKVRPCTGPEFLDDHGVGEDDKAFRGLHIAKPTNLAWLGKQPFAKYVVQVSLHRDAIAPLAALPTLAILLAPHSKSKDYDALGKLTELRELDLWGAAIRDLRGVSALRKLIFLQLFKTGISDVSPLAALTQLRCLSLCGTVVSDLAPLANLTKLTSLNISRTKVTDFTPLAKLKELHTLYAWELAPTNLDALHGLKSLRTIELLGTKASPGAVAALRKALPKADVTTRR